MEATTERPAVVVEAERAAVTAAEGVAVARVAEKEEGRAVAKEVAATATEGKARGCADREVGAAMERARPAAAGEVAEVGEAVEGPAIAMVVVVRAVVARVAAAQAAEVRALAALAWAAAAAVMMLG